MKLMLLFVTLSAFFVGSTIAFSDSFIADLWHEFTKQHNKTYISSTHEAERLKVFKKNIELIDKHNTEYSMGLHSYTLGINVFADWTAQEFRERMLGLRANMTRVKHGSLSTFLRLDAAIKTPDSVDWREKEAVTPVKNQGECGSCWSFSTTGSMEGAYARAFGKLVSLSEQQLVDCSGKFGNEGCNGGLMDNAFQYVKEFGLETEEDYPYKATQGKCHYKKDKVVATCTGYIDIPTQDEEALKDAVATVGPVSVAIDATQEKFMFYKHGVFVDDTCSNQQDSLDHGVLVVGYGTDNGNDYWIVKNSWGTSWGEEGYIRMARNKENMCGIATSASYPLVKS